jgi:hypothetical protein
VSVVVREADVCAGLWLSAGVLAVWTQLGRKGRGTFDAAVAGAGRCAVRYPVADVQAEVCFLVRLDAALGHRGCCHGAARPAGRCVVRERRYAAMYGREFTVRQEYALSQSAV